MSILIPNPVWSIKTGILKIIYAQHAPNMFVFFFNHKTLYKRIKPPEIPVTHSKQLIRQQLANQNKSNKNELKAKKLIKLQLTYRVKDNLQTV